MVVILQIQSINQYLFWIKYKMNVAILSILLSLLLVKLVPQTTVVNATKSYTSVTPTWLTSPFFRAGNEAVISTLTGNSQTPTYTFTFSSALTTLPYLAYGVKNYRGNDYLLQEFYEIKKIGLTQSTFSVSIQIYGITNIWLLTVAYLAVEPTFPHHFNTFDNVPLNYSSGAIVNISTPTNQLTSFTEYINYTSQAAGKTYDKFTTPLSSNTIVLFMTSLWIVGTSSLVHFHIYSQVIDSQQYMLNATLQLNVKITNVHFSMAIFNKDDIVSSNRYQVVYEEWDDDMSGGGFKAIPYQFVDNFIMGVTAFQATGGQCGFEYQWEFTNSTGVFGVQLLRSWTLTNTCGFSWSRTSMLYIRTWLCPSPYLYYNITTMMCQDFCGGYHVENATGALCEPCTNFMCYQCDSANKSVCTDCASFEHMELVNDTCACVLGYFYLEGQCVTCDTQNLGCYNCSYGILSQTLPFNASQFICYTCNQTQNYFLVNSSCVACSITNCTNCTSLTHCSACSVGFVLNLEESACTTCLVVGCLSCLANDTSLCDTCYTSRGYFLNSTTRQCDPVCGDGLTANATGTEACDDGNLVDGDGCSSVCQFEPNFNCTIQPNFTTVCLEVCGDNATLGREGCDDGNFLNGDGCSSDCRLEVSLSLIRQQRDMDKCNGLRFDFEVKPFYASLSSMQFDKAIVMNSSALVNPSFSYDSPKLSLSYDFTEDMTQKTVQYSQNSTLFLQYPSYTFYIPNPTIKVSAQNNVALNFLGQQQCEQKQFYSKAFESVKIASFAMLFASMIPGKIIGLQLFGVLQLAYFSVGSIDSVNVLLYPLMSMKQLNGYSAPFFGSSSEFLPQRVQSIRYCSSFLDNFNAMFLLVLIQFIVGVVLYLLNKFIGNTKMESLALRLLKEFFLTLLLFNCFNICYACGIQFRFSGESLVNPSTLLAIVSVSAVFAMACAAMFIDSTGFGEFKQKFKKDFVSSNYISVSIMYRGIVGFLLAYSNEDDLSTLFTLGCSLLFFIYSLVNLPFAKAYHNYRACLCHLAHLITIFVAMYYRAMKPTTSPSQTSAIFSPAKVQFWSILSVLVVSAMGLIYDSYLFIKEYVINNKLVRCEAQVQDRVQQKRSRGVDASEVVISEIQVGNSDYVISEINMTEQQLQQISEIVVTPK